MTVISYINKVSIQCTWIHECFIVQRTFSFIWIHNSHVIYPPIKLILQVLKCICGKAKNPSVWFCLEPYFVFMTFKQRQIAFIATHMALNQQSLASAVSPVEAQKWNIILALFPIKFKIVQNRHSRKKCYMSNSWYMQNPASTEEKSRFSFG